MLKTTLRVDAQFDEDLFLENEELPFDEIAKSESGRKEVTFLFESQCNELMQNLHGGAFHSFGTVKVIKVEPNLTPNGDFDITAEFVAEDREALLKLIEVTGYADTIDENDLEIVPHSDN